MSNHSSYPPELKSRKSPFPYGAGQFFEPAKYGGTRHSVRATLCVRYFERCSGTNALRSTSLLNNSHE